MVEKNKDMKKREYKKPQLYDECLFVVTDEAMAELEKEIAEQERQEAAECRRAKNKSKKRP